jgi:hypothetical protein
MTAMYEYYDEEWQAKVFKCPECLWSGTYDEKAGELLSIPAVNTHIECLDNRQIDESRR